MEYREEPTKLAEDASLFHSVAAQRLQVEAWTAYNFAFHVPEADEYRKAGRDLYQQVLEERIRALFLKGDEQNRLLDLRTDA